MKLIVGNWKMNQTLAEVKSFFETMKSAQRRHEAWIAPQALHIPLALSLAPASVKIGAQNCSDKKAGAFTGENSPISLKELGADFVLVGHSERRQLFNETDATCALKTKLALETNLTVIYCVGETLAEREAGNTIKVVTTQLRTGLKDIGTWQPGQLIIAYEPVWAIGTGMTATPEQAQAMHAYIRSFVPENTSILYGGSVKASNAATLFAMPDIDGALVGGASLNAQEFMAIVSACNG